MASRICAQGRAYGGRAKPGGAGDFYDRVYGPNVRNSFKAPAARVVGPREPIRIRRIPSGMYLSRSWCWCSPPAEQLSAIQSAMTCRRDRSKVRIPFIYPQAKVYDGSCALGPVISLSDSLQHERAIQMIISRGGGVSL